MNRGEKLEAWENKWEDYYFLLGIKPAASDAEIKSAYRQMAKDFHPDTVVSASDAVRKMASEKFKSANRAYEVLGDSTKKGMYDTARRARTSSSAGSSARSSAPPPPPPRPAASVIAVDQASLFATASEGESVEVSFTVRLVSGTMPPTERLVVKYRGDFLDTARITVDPPDRLPARVRVVLPYAEAGEFEGEFEVVVQ